MTISDKRIKKLESLGYSVTLEKVDGQWDIWHCEATRDGESVGAAAMPQSSTDQAALRDRAIGAVYAKIMYG